MTHRDDDFTEVHMVDGRVVKVRKIKYGGGMFVDGINKWVVHYRNPTGRKEDMHHSVEYEHPWDDSYEAHICPVCGGDIWSVYR